jgi:hypothetical protein
VELVVVARCALVLFRGGKEDEDEEKPQAETVHVNSVTWSVPPARHSLPHSSVSRATCERRRGDDRTCRGGRCDVAGRSRKNLCGGDAERWWLRPCEGWAGPGIFLRGDGPEVRGQRCRASRNSPRYLRPVLFCSSFRVRCSAACISGNWLVSSTPMATRKAIGFLSSVVQNTNRAPPCNCALDFDGSFLDP